MFLFESLTEGIEVGIIFFIGEKTTRCVRGINENESMCLSGE